MIKYYWGNYERKKYTLLIILVCTLIDQITKLLIVNNIELNTSVNIIKNLLNFTYIKNYGVAFGIFTNMTYFIIIVTFIIFVLLTKELKKYFNKKIILLSYSILIGGLFGNLIDRMILGYVRDFIDIKLFNFPIFNMSDVFIVGGTFLLLIACYKLEKESKKGETNERNTNNWWI